MSSINQFRMLLLSSFISSTGSLFLTLSLAAYIFMQTGSALMSSLVFVFTFLPPIFVGTRAGHWVDSHFSKRMLAGSELASIFATVACALMIHFKAPVVLLALVLSARAILSFVSKSAFGRWIKLISPPNEQAQRFKIFSLAYFIAYALSGALSAAVLKSGSILLVASIDVLTYLAGAAIILAIPAFKSESEDSAKPQAAPGKINFIDTLLEIYYTPALRNSFLTYVLLSTICQGAHQAFSSYIPIKHLGLGNNYIGYFQTVLGLGIIVGFLINWKYPNALNSRKDGSNRRVAMVVLGTVIANTLVTYTQNPAAAFFSFFISAILVEWAFMHAVSSFFRSSPSHAVGRYQFTMTSLGCFLMSVFNSGASAAMDKLGAFDGLGLALATGLGFLFAVDAVVRQLLQSRISKDLPSVIHVQDVKAPLTSNTGESAKSNDLEQLFNGSLVAIVTISALFTLGRTTLVSFEVFNFDLVTLLSWSIVLTWMGIAYLTIVRPSRSKSVEAERNNELARMAAQVAHDIQSPLSVLTTVIHNAEALPQAQRLMLRAAASRIQNIADELLYRWRNSVEPIEKQSFAFIKATIESIVAEKNTLIPESRDIEITVDVEKSIANEGVPMAVSHFGRVLSNLLNNSLESFLASAASKRIEIRAFKNPKNPSTVSIVVKDNGRGMTPEILQRVRTIGGSFDKTNGFGLGLSDARRRSIEVGGALDIESWLGDGTAVTVTLPLAERPRWYNTYLDINPSDTVVVLDDDESIHLLWAERLAGYKVIHLKDTSEFDPGRYTKHNHFFIMDYEIIGSSVTGLDLIRTRDLGSRSVLVTSYFNDPKIQEAVLENRSKLLPKYMISQVQIGQPQPAPVTQLEIPKQSYDFVLIDDDELVHMAWRHMAGIQNHKVLHAKSVEDLPESLPISTPIFIDKNLGKGVDGILEAKKLKDLGFARIYLCTGDQLVNVKDYPFLNGVTSKDYPQPEYLQQ